MTIFQTCYKQTNRPTLQGAKSVSATKNMQFNCLDQPRKGNIDGNSILPCTITNRIDDLSLTISTENAHEKNRIEEYDCAGYLFLTILLFMYVFTFLSSFYVSFSSADYKVRGQIIITENNETCNIYNNYNSL